MKQPYKTLFVSPQHKVPLYQTVFHDEVINSHHWHTDSLKFTDVQVERDLTSMLYNTPAMVHLSRDEADQIDAPRIKALQRYQQGLLQQTTLSDGSRIVANFTQRPQRLADNRVIQPTSILARLSDRTVVNWKPISGNLIQ